MQKYVKVVICMMDICTENSIIVRKYVLNIYPSILCLGLYIGSRAICVFVILFYGHVFYIIMRMFQK